MLSVTDLRGCNLSISIHDLKYIDKSNNSLRTNEHNFNKINNENFSDNNLSKKFFINLILFLNNKEN